MPRYNKSDTARTPAKTKAKVNASATQGGNSVELRGFVKHSKGAEVKAQFVAYLSSDEATFRDNAALYLDGFKVSSQWDADSDCVRATAFSNEHGRSDCGLALTVWAANFYEAHALLAFFIYACGMGSIDNSFFTLPEDKVKRTFWD